ncbi:MAG: nicotinate phosphoribosyltransferase [Lutibacter sp.]|nr:nicotinate phosphoribosyltransferase [Lutibacter sp.]
MNVLNGHLGLFIDRYELTMAEGYFRDGRENVQANFDYFFRKNPFDSGFTVFSGLQDLLEMIQEFEFDASTIDHLHKEGFHAEFLEYLKKFHFKGIIEAPDEGEVIFPNEPILSVQGSLIETQLLETIVLNTLNFQSLIATKANRLRKAAGNRTIIDFGMRRAQGWAAIHGSRAAIAGGVDGTSNELASFLYGLKAVGTMAHSWVQSYEDELTAFRKYAEFHPVNCVLLVDTYNTLKIGIPNAIIVAKEMEQRGQRLFAIRLDSGDLAYLSKKTRKMLDDVDLTYIKIVASNQLDEYLINSLILQGAKIDSFGIGTSLITGQKDAALDGVYKLTDIDNRPVIKLSENVAKITLPGKKKIIRFFNDTGTFYADGIMLSDENENDIDVITHPQFSEKKSSVIGLKREQIGSMVMKSGEILLKKKSISEISEYRKFRVSQLSEEYKRFEFPHVYKVGLSKKLKKQRDLLINKEY